MSSQSPSGEGWNSTYEYGSIEARKGLFRIPGVTP